MQLKILFLFLIFLMVDSYSIHAQNPLPDSIQVATTLDKYPSPKGGMQAFYQYLARNFRYPTEARENGIEGKVLLVQFIVNLDSTLTDIKILEGIGGGCNEEAIRILKNSPKWIPGEQNNRRVRTYMVIPILFKLGGDDYPAVRKRLVIVDGVEAGMVDRQLSVYNELKINPKKVKDIQYLTAPEAQTKYGEKGKNGAVIITTKKKKK
jgi:TonB family protein